MEFSILVLVASNPEVNQKQLGQALDVSAPNMAITLDRMVERGWVERVRSTQDRRAMLIHLTRGRPRAGAARREDRRDDGERARCACSRRAERALLVELLLKVGLQQPARRRAARAETASG